MNNTLETYEVQPVSRPIQYDIRVPGSKSITNRALLLAALAQGQSELTGVLFSNDSEHFAGSLRALGVTLDVDAAQGVITVDGIGGSLPRTKGTIDVGSAGTAARFLTSVVALNPGEFVVNASSQMQRRPMGPLIDALTQAGARFEFLGQPGYLPYRVYGTRPTVDRVEIDSTTTSQFLSSLLLVAPLFPKPTRIVLLGPVPTQSYVTMTLRVMRSFGYEVTIGNGDYATRPGVYRSTQYAVEPDVSSACYFAGAAAVTGGSVLLRDVHWDTLQGDIAFLRILEKMGCTLREEAAGIRIDGPPGGKLQGVSVDMNDCADQVPTLAALAPFAESTVEIHNVEQVRHHESDRLHAVATELQRMGIACKELPAGLVIEPGSPQPTVVNTYDDHRLAMAFSLVGLRAEGIEIADPGCTSKTFPTYFDIFDEMVGAHRAS